MFVLFFPGGGALYHANGEPYLRALYSRGPFQAPSKPGMARRWLETIDEYLASRRADSNSKERFVRESFAAATKAADLLRSHLTGQEAST